MRQLVLLIICSSLVVGWPLGEVLAATDQPVDLRIVVDVSQTMQRLDVDDLHSSAIELLVHALPEGANAGLWAYSRNTTKVVDYEPATALWKQIAGIRGANLTSRSDLADLPGALQAVTWDLQTNTAHYRDVVLLSNGRISLASGAVEQARQELLGEWATRLQSARVRVHTLALAAPGDSASSSPQADAEMNNQDVLLLRQLAEVSGGVHAVVDDVAAMQAAIVEVQQVIAQQPQAMVDEVGRFQVAPGASQMTLLWFNKQLNSLQPSLMLPTGDVLTRLTPIKQGRWLVARDFEMVTLNDPQPGWWRVDGPKPASLTVFGEIEVRVAGLQGTLVPTDESSATITLHHNGRQITHEGFLDLLNVSAWVVQGDDRFPLPIDRDGGQYTAYFVNLADGRQKLEVEVIAPTFARQLTLPFVVANPLVVRVVQDAEDAPKAWLSFSHPQVDYATVRATGITRKPPSIAALIPAEQLPGGLWQIPIDHREGIVQLSFSVAGNYLDGKGFFVKTKHHAVSFPLTDGEALELRYDAQGKLINLPLTPAAPAEITVASDPGAKGAAANLQDLSASQATARRENSKVQETAPIAAEPALPLLPWWFVVLIGVLNLALGGVVWWLNKPKPLPADIT